MNDSALPQIVYAEGSSMSTLPIRNAAAIVVIDDVEQALIVQRGPALPEFPGVWSFPSVYEIEGVGLWQRLELLLREELLLEFKDTRVVARRMGLRPQWRILMHLYVARHVRGPMPRGRKYDAFRWVNGREYAARQQGSKPAGDCMLAYSEYLRRTDAARGYECPH